VRGAWVDDSEGGKRLPWQELEKVITVKHIALSSGK